MGGPGQEEVLLSGRLHDFDHQGHRLPSQPHPHPPASTEGEEPLLGDLRCLVQDSPNGGCARPLSWLHGQYAHPDRGTGLHHHLRVGAQVCEPVLAQQHSEVCGGRRDGVPGGSDHHCAHRHSVTASDDARTRGAPDTLQGQTQSGSCNHEAQTEFRTDP